MASMQAASRTDAQATQAELESKKDATTDLSAPILPTVRHSKRNVNITHLSNHQAQHHSNRLDVQPTTVSKVSQSSSKVEKGRTFIHNCVMYHITSANKIKSVVYAHSDDLLSKVRFNLKHVEEII